MGFVPFLLSAAKRAGMIAGIAVTAAALALYPFFVTDVKIVGDECAGVYEVLERNGIREGVFLRSLDESDVSKQILALDGVAFASVVKNGTHVLVTVRAELEDGNFADLGGASVKSAKTAAVTRVIVYGGTAEVEYGDVVRPGDVLIGGYVAVGDEKVDVNASGEVYGKVYYERTYFFADTAVSRTRGKTVTYSRLSLFGSAPKAPEPPFGDYELETSVSANGFLIPFRRYTWRYTEIEYKEKENTLSEEEMTAVARSALMTETPAGAVVLACYPSVERRGGGTYARIVIETEERIDS